MAALHLPKLGAKLTVLTDEQAAYINVPTNGPFKVRLIRYAMNLPACRAPLPLLKPGCTGDSCWWYLCASCRPASTRIIVLSPAAASSTSFCIIFALQPAHYRY